MKAAVAKKLPPIEQALAKWLKAQQTEARKKRNGGYK